MKKVRSNKRKKTSSDAGIWRNFHTEVRIQYWKSGYKRFGSTDRNALTSTGKSIYGSTTGMIYKSTDMIVFKIHIKK